MTSIQIVSDLHLEVPKAYDVYEITPAAPYLALLGDIGSVVHGDDFYAFLTRQLRQFRAVLFVPGNHEAFGSSWDATLTSLRAFGDAAKGDASLGEFVVMDRGAYHVPGTGTLILGCSLFSRVTDGQRGTVETSIRDFWEISDWDVDAHNEAHGRDLAWLNGRVAEAEGDPGVRDVVLATHWSPSAEPRAADPRHARSPIGSGFATDLSGQACFAAAKVRLWAFGHTHYNCDFEVARPGGAGPLRLLANQRGYYFAQAAGFDERLCVQLNES
ncbi:hypothetical protein N3K66_001462 [Trichothecium roseum]|uniref:Uncharacterized protein n=1 Tax=Trichothecium roseum TaxID=47278 RepID=A0ACC0VFN8_9HYPO|nr:hypothetical protein N3K66_001462 [Trichothecium roseum]